jgi:hypothetical protein
VPCNCHDFIEESPAQKIEVLKILGQGSQGVVALCCFSESPPKKPPSPVYPPANKVPLSVAQNLLQSISNNQSTLGVELDSPKNAFVVKIFRHHVDKED